MHGGVYISISRPLFILHCILLCPLSLTLFVVCCCRGYFFGPDANWNRLDFFIVIIGWLEENPRYLGALPFNLSFLRVFRVFRPLKTLTKVDGMKELVSTLFLCVDPLIDVLGLTFFVFFVFGVLGMELFQGNGEILLQVAMRVNWLERRPHIRLK